MCALEFRPIKANRLFASGLRYDQVDWNEWHAVIEAFRIQMENWYLGPIGVLRANGDHSFAYLSLCCTLVDTLSQYFYGVEEGTQKEFKDFLDEHFIGFSSNLSVPIIYTYGGKQRKVITFSDALYSGFRCGIIHEAHAKLYTRIWGTGQIVLEDLNNYTTYPNGAPCSTVILDPGIFHERLLEVFKKYLDDLKGPFPESQPLRNRFAKKFLHSYGIDIGNER
jgi:hypothetical protein